MGVTGQKCRVPGTRSGKDDGIGRGQFVLAAGLCGSKGDLGIERHDLTDLREGDHLADLATLAFRSAVLGPLAQALGGAFGGGLGSTAVATTAAAVLHTGGHVGQAGTTRSVPAYAFAGAPRLHRGGWAGLRPDEVPAILQRGERVLSRREVSQSVTGARAAPVEVVVTLDESTGRLGAFVRREAGGVAQAAIGAYNSHVLPQRVQQIGADTRVRGR